MINWGMIGCGSVAETKSGPAFNNCEDSKLVFVMSNNESRTRAFAERHGIPNWTTDHRELIYSDKVDAVYVATPPDSHNYYCKQVADCGKPVLVEKPLARDLEEATDLVRYCDKQNARLYVAYYRRALPRFLAVKQLIQQGVIGDVRFVHIQHTESPEDHGVSPINTNLIPDTIDLPWRFLPDTSGGGNFVDCGTHLIDMVDFLLGHITDVHGIAVNRGGYYPAEDSVCASFIVNRTILGSGQWNYVSGAKTDRIEISGSHGRILISSFDDHPIEVFSKGETQLLEHRNPQYWSEPFIQTVVDELVGRGTCASRSDNALRAMAVQERLLAPFYGRKQIKHR